MITFNANTGFEYSSNQSCQQLSKDHINRLKALQTKAESILGNSIQFEKWLRSSFGNDTNLSSLLSTPEGLQVIEKQLDLIAEGYPV